MSVENNDTAEEQIDLESEENSIEDQDSLEGEGGQATDDDGQNTDENDANAENDSEDGNSTESDEAAEIDLESNEVVDLLDSQSKKDEQEEADKKRNAAYASLRRENRKLKQLQSRLENNQLDINPDDFGQKPNLREYLSDEKLYGEFNGNEALAKATHQEDLEKWQRNGQGLVNKARGELQQEIQREEYFDGIQGDFEERTKSFGHVKDLGRLINQAESAMQVAGDKEGEVLDGTLIIKQEHPENAPMMLALLGTNPKLAERLMSLQEPNQIYKFMADLEQKAISVLDRAPRISKAQAETTIDGGNAGGSAQISDLDKKIDEAADAGNFDLYSKLKKQKKDALSKAGAA